MGHEIDVTTLDGSGSFKAYVAEPAGKPKAAVVVIQEIFGINPGIRKMADDWAAKGYVALAPDIFWRLEPGVQLDADVESDWTKAIALMQALNVDDAVSDIQATIRKGRSLAGGGKAGVVGYCLGGRLAFLTAARTDTDASVGYYGGGIDQVLDESNAIGKPVMLHFGTKDAHINSEALAAIHQKLDGNSHVTIHDYEGKDHAFARAIGSARDEEAANLADGRTAAFFEKHLA